VVALVWLVIIAIASLLVVRLGTTALVLTGLERDTSDSRHTQRSSRASSIARSSLRCDARASSSAPSTMRSSSGYTPASLSPRWPSTATSPLAGQVLSDAGLADHGIVVLGITRADGAYVAAPRPDTVLRPSDVLTVYGRDRDVRTLVAAAATGATLPPG